MKRFFVVVLLSLITYNAYSQRFIGSAILGMNMTQVPGDDVAGFKKVGVNGGASVMLAMDKKQRWFVTVELLYNQKGSRSGTTRAFDTATFAPSMYEDVDPSYEYNPSAKYKCRLNLDYVEIPLVFHYEDWRTGCAFGLGASWGRLVYASEYYNGYKRLTNIRSNTYKTSDWSIILDAKIRLWKGLKLNIRYERSLVPIRTFDIKYADPAKLSEHLTQYNSVISLRLIYSFNEKYIENFKTNKKGTRQGPKWVREL